MTVTRSRDIFTFADAPKPEHFGAMEHAATIPWAKLNEVEEKVAMTLAARQIMMVWGHPGTGKTHALRYALRAHVFAELVFSETPNRKETVDAIHVALFGRPGQGNAGQIERRLKIAFAERDVILVVEEFESLNNKRLHLVRTLQDFAGSRLTVFLVGDESSRAEVDRDRRLSRRILTDVHFASMSLEAVLEHLPTYHPLFAEAKPSRLAQLYQECFNGNWGDIARWTRIAEYTAAEEGASTLTPRLIAKVQARFWMPGAVVAG